MSGRRWQAFVTTFVALLACACRPAPPPPPFDSAWDPRLVALDHAAPYTDFDGAHGSILLDEGWGSYEKNSSRLGWIFSDPFDFAWVIGDTASIHFERPNASQLDFFAVCLPFRNPELRQELILTIDGREVGRQELENDWQQVRIPLTDGTIGPGWQEMQLSFRYAVSPKEVGESDDDRRLAAAFRRLAIVPRGISDVDALFDDTELDGDRPDSDESLRLAPHTEVTLPLPASSTAILHLGRLTAGVAPAKDCGLRFDLTGDEIWKGTWSEAIAAGDVAFVTPDGAPSRLRLAHEGCGDLFEMPFPPTLLSVERRERKAQRPHVFVYVVDTLRADALSVYGSKRRTSPRLEAFARDAVTYLDVWSPSAWTLPSVVSLLTSTYPDRHRVSLDLDRLTAENFPTLAERLHDHGFATLGVSQSFIISGQFGLEAGFDDFYLSDQLGGTTLRSQEVRGYLLQWLLHRWDGHQPIFAYLHTVDPHAPYLPADRDRHFAAELPQTLSAEEYSPEVFVTRNYAAGSPEAEQLRARYDGEVAWADREFGRFLDMLRHLGLYDNSIILLTSDHGEEFGEHGGFGHGRTMHEEMLQVPLLVKYPRGEGAGTQVDEQVNIVDVLPTILHWVGLDPTQEALDGKVLPPFASAERRYGFSEVKALPAPHLAAVHYRAFRTDGVKCIENVAGVDQYDRPAPRWQGFDLVADPAEQEPLNEDDTRFARCRETLGRWIQSRQTSNLHEGSSLNDLDEATRQRLRAVGYIE